MSTSYPIFATANRVLEIHKHSNMFDIELSNTSKGTSCAVPDLIPAQIIRAACEMLRVSSYWLSSEEFDTLVTEEFRRNCPGEHFIEAINYMRARMLNAE